MSPAAFVVISDKTAVPIKTFQRIGIARPVLGGGVQKACVLCFSDAFPASVGAFGADHVRIGVLCHAPAQPYSLVLVDHRGYHGIAVINNRHAFLVVKALGVSPCVELAHGIGVTHAVLNICIVKAVSGRVPIAVIL